MGEIPTPKEQRFKVQIRTLGIVPPTCRELAEAIEDNLDVIGAENRHVQVTVIEDHD